MKPQRWLTPLTPIYSAAVAAKNAAYDRGLIRQKTLREPVISIGNLSTGGGGKTPFAIALAMLITEAGMAADVLSRGYGRGNATVEQVDASGGSSAAQFGDEPLLIARAAGVPVFVGPQRYQAGLLAEEGTRRVHLLDDGFQHRQLARDLDIVLLHCDDLHTRLLPAGHLREPLSGLRRADAVVLRDEDRALEGEFRRYLKSEASIWYLRRELKLERREGKSLAFCGIARPEEFFAGLRAMGTELVETIAFPDHHAFSKVDLLRIGARVKALRVERILTTEKDLTRLSQAALATLCQYAPVERVVLCVTLLEPQEVLSRVGSLLKR